MYTKTKLIWFLIDTAAEQGIVKMMFLEIGWTFFLNWLNFLDVLAGNFFGTWQHWWLTGQREILSLSSSFLHIEVRHNINEAWRGTLPLEKGIFFLQKHQHLGYMTPKFLLLFPDKYNALLLFHFYTKIYETLQ
jgi:hypothetical protein